MTTDKIRSKGHWDVSIRPERFSEHRIDYADLDEVLGAAVVRFRGWPVPFIDHRKELLRREDWIGQDIAAESVSMYEAWRFFTSGHFNHLCAVSADWRGGESATAVPEGFCSVIEVWEILYHLTEFFELAARLALSPAGDDPMTVDIRLNRLQGRALVVGYPGVAPIGAPHSTGCESLRQAVTISRDGLVAEARQVAVRTAREFFVRFGWKPSAVQLTDFQRRLTELGG